MSDTTLPLPDIWLPVRGRVMRKTVCEFNPKRNAIRIRARWHGTKVEEVIKLPMSEAECRKEATVPTPREAVQDDQ